MWKSNLPCNIYVSSQLSVLSRQVGDLQADNLKLYEKIRFLQVISEDKIKHHGQMFNLVETKYSIKIQCWILLRSFLSGLWRGKQEKWGGGSSWEQAWHYFHNKNSCLQCILLQFVSLVSYLELLVGTGTRRVMSRSWTPSPTSVSKRSRGSMASSLYLRRGFIFYSSLG